MKEIERKLREGAEKVSAGKIRIDSKRALQRLRDFRFADPSHWILEVLRCAVESNARTVEVETDADDVIIEFGGSPIPASALDHLLERALEPGTTHEERRIRLLALGIAGALGAGAAWVTVETAGKKLTLEGDDVQLTDAPSVKGTRVHLHKKFGWRVFTGLLRGSPEAQAVRQKVHRFPTKLNLDGKHLASVRKKVPDLVSEQHRGDGWVLDLDFDRHDEQRHSILWLEVSGVVVSSRLIACPGVQFNAWLSSNDLRRNASGSDVIDEDESLIAAIEKMKARSIAVLQQQLESLCELAAWRQLFFMRLAQANAEPDKPEHKQLQKVLRKAPMIPGPAGEWHSLDEIEQAKNKVGVLHFALTRHPKGSYPEPTVLLRRGDTELEQLMPDGKRLDVEKLVKLKKRVAEARAELAAREVVPAELGSWNTWELSAPITGANLAGEVGLDTRERGAFVKVLAEGRPFHAAEMSSLAPLRLRAVVDWRRPIGDTYFEDDGPDRLLGLVMRVVEETAIAAICAGLESGMPEAAPHALDLLTRFGNRNAKRAEIPRPVLDAPLFDVVGGKRVSLAELDKWKRWAFVFGERQHGLLNGEPVLELTSDLHAMLKRLGGRRLDDVGAQLDAEASIRRRMAGPPEQAAVKDPHVALVAVGRSAAEAAGGSDTLKGEVALPREKENRLLLTVLRDGLRLETTQLSARYGSARAVIASSALTPNDNWQTVKRDAAWQSVLNAVQAAEKRLAGELVRVPRNQWGANGEEYLKQFLQKELRLFNPAKLDATERAVVDAPLFDAGKKRVSLDQLSRERRLLAWTRTGQRPEVPEDMVVVFEGSDVVALLSEALGRPFEDAAPELERAEVRRRLDSMPELEFELTPRAPIEVRVTGSDWNAIAGLREGSSGLARVDLRVQRRAYLTFNRATPLPLGVVIEMPMLMLEGSRSLNQADNNRIDDALAAVTQELIAEALRQFNRSSDSAAARAVLLLALGKKADSTIKSKLTGDAMRRAKLFACTDGKFRSFDDFEGAVQFVKSPLAGTLPNKKPIVIADSEVTRAGLERFTRIDDVEGALRLQLKAEEQRQAIAAVTEVKSHAESWWRAPVNQDGITGEVIVALSGGGKLELFYEKKPLCTLHDVIPSAFSAAIDSPRLSPKPGFMGVEQDAGLTEVIELVTSYGGRLGDKIASQPIPPGWESAAVRLAFQLAVDQSWEWKGRRNSRGNQKGKGKKKEQPSAPVHELIRRQLLRANDGSTLCVKDLLDVQMDRGQVAMTQRGGTFLENKRAWWPREQEQSWAVGLGLTLADASSELEQADRVRALPVFQTVEVPMVSRWRAPVKGNGLEGEVVILESPSTHLVVEVLHGRRLLERWISEHPIGGQGRVQSAHVTPDAAFTAAKRDSHFKTLMVACEAALERAVLERVQKHEGGLTHWIRSVMKWKRGSGGPIFDALAQLPLFEGLDGKAVTTGAVIALAARQGKVPVADRGLSAEADQLVLINDVSTLQALEALGLKHEVVSGELQRKTQLQQNLTARRMSSLTFKGEAVVRHKLPPPLEGELALTFTEGDVVLARDGIPVGTLERRAPLGVVGVVGLRDLQVNDTWTQSTLTRAQREAIAEQIDVLFSMLAREVPKLSELDRERATTAGLAYLLQDSSGGRVNFNDLRGGARAIARAPLFVTGENSRVSLEHLASAASSSGKVAIFQRSSSVPKAEVVVCSTFDVPWLSALESALGKNKVWRVFDRAAWDQHSREADPEEGTPLAQGLSLLRKNVRLLRSGALGRLTPEDLEDVKLSRDGGKTAMRYDGKRKLVLLDPDHPHVKRALSEVRAYPERLWILLAAVFGVVNRALAHVTDEHEAQLSLALAAHLAANPQLLEPQT
ncbi:MAG: hypothetical protein JNM17_16485 [Archangium sp.]|nr:hypothetical protein [Archangium sp.]